MFVKDLAFRLLEPVVYLLWRMTPPERLQGRLYRLCRIAALPGMPIYRLRRADASRAHLAAMLLNHALTHMTRRGWRFPLQVDLAGAAPALERLRAGRGVLLVAVHTCLTMAAHGAFAREGALPVFVGLARKHRTGGLNWGDPRPVASIDAEHPLVLRQMNEALAAGQAVITFVDHDPRLERRQGRRVRRVSISPNALSSIRPQAPAVFFLHSAIGADGRIRLGLTEIPHAGDAADPEGLAQAAALAAMIGARMGWHCEVARPARRPGPVVPAAPTPPSAFA